VATEKGWRSRGRSAAAGAGLALATWFVLGKLGVAEVIQRGLPVDMAMVLLAGALIGFVGLIALEWAVLGLSITTLLLVAWIPLIDGPVRGMVRADSSEPERVDAVVALSGRVTSEGRIGNDALSRLLTAITLAQRGPSLELVLTRVFVVLGRDTVWSDGDQRDLVERFGSGLTLHLVGPTRDTHDEAVEVAALARRQGWRRVTLVTSPLHARRACEVFERQGLVVRCRPSEERDYNPTGLRTAEDRSKAFHDWIYETVATWVYRSRGWLR